MPLLFPLWVAGKELRGPTSNQFGGFAHSLVCPVVPTGDLRPQTFPGHHRCLLGASFEQQFARYLACSPH